jgi:hypothetical protein
MDRAKQEAFAARMLGVLNGGVLALMDQHRAPEAAAVLTSVAGPPNLARYMQYIPMLAEVEADVTACHETVSLALGGAGLGTVWGEQTALEMLREAGLGKVEVSRLEDDPLNNYYVARR